MKIKMKKELKNFLWIGIVLFAMALSSCEKESNDENKKEEPTVIPNKLVGTWRFESSTNFYWYEMKFNLDSTGTRIDADNENDIFTYTYTETELKFTSGFPFGRHDYKVIKDTLLVLFNDTLRKKN
jgi:hypothetical protein